MSQKPPRWQDPGPRTKALIEKHGIYAIQKAFADPDYLAKTFDPYDGLLIMGLAQGLRGDGKEREAMLNRMFGKVPDRAITMNLNIEVTPEQLNARADALLARLAGGDDDLELIGN